MKKLKKILLMLGFLLATFAISQPVSAEGWDYYADVYVDKMDGRTYLVSYCVERPGDDCNMVGSAHRTDISALFSWIKKF